MLGVLLFSGCGADIKFPVLSEWPTAAIPDYAHSARYAITDNLSDTLSVVSTDPAPVVYGTVPVGDIPVELEGPHHLASAPDGSFVVFNLSNYVPGTGSGPHGSHGTGTVPGSLVRLDGATLQEQGETLVDRSPGDVILSKDGKTAFVTHYDLLKVQSQMLTGGAAETAYSSLAIIDTESMRRLSLQPICPTSHGEGLSADEKTLYVTCSLSDQIVVVDVTDHNRPNVTSRVAVGPMPGPLGTPNYWPYALTVSPKDGSVWVSDNKSGDVRVYDPTTGQMDPARVIFVGGVAMFGAFTADGGTYYVPHQGGNDLVTAIDTQTLTTRDLALPSTACLNAHALVMMPDGVQALVVCEGDHMTRPGSMVTLQLPSFSISGFVNVGMFADGAAYLPPISSN